MTRLWAKREEQIRGVIESTACMYGDLPGGSRGRAWTKSLDWSWRCFLRGKRISSADRIFAADNQPEEFGCVFLQFLADQLQLHVKHRVHALFRHGNIWTHFFPIPALKVVCRKKLSAREKFRVLGIALDIPVELHQRQVTLHLISIEGEDPEIPSSA
jgi:hypothetical protein